MRLVIFVLLTFSFLAGLFTVTGFSQGPATNQNSSIKMAEESRLNAEMVELYKQQKFEEAARVGRQLLTLREGMYGVEHARVANSLSDMAEISLLVGKNSDAERLYLRALAILEKQPSSDPLLLSVCLQRLGDLKFGKQEYASAAELLQRALTIRQSRLAGKDDDSTFTITHSLANTLQMLRRFDEAEELYVNSLTKLENALSREHPVVVARMKDYACLKYNSKDMSDPKVAAEELHDPHGDIRYRAECWLYGFRSDCATSVPLELKPHSTKPHATLNGRAFMLPKPEYPMRARAIKQSGRIIVAVVIDKNGDVSRARSICGGPPLLREPSVRAARGAKFSQTIVEGKPIEVTGIITYNYISP